MGLPSPTALSRLRGRLGEAPFAALLGRLASPLALAGGPGSRACGLTVVGWDGTLLEVPASGANVAALGRQRGTHYPQIRLVALVACGTRAVLGAALGAAAERELAGELLGALGKGMLLLADRGFFSFDLWRQAAGTGADLLWRVKGGLHLRPVRLLPDGAACACCPARSRHTGPRAAATTARPPPGPAAGCGPARSPGPRCGSSRSR